MKKKDVYTIVLIAIAVGLFPWGACGTDYSNTLLVFLGNNAITTMGLTLLMGYAGQISLGHAAFFGLGAYSSGILTTQYSLHPAVAFCIGILLAAAIAYVVGKPTLRL